MNRKLRMSLFAVVLLFVMSCPALAEIKLSPLFSDGMVVQRERPIHVWGTATPGKKVSVFLRKENPPAGQFQTDAYPGPIAGSSSVADELGYWDVYLPAMKATGPFSLMVLENAPVQTVLGTAPAAVVIHDILVGDVWIASGQSNMEFPMARVDNAQAEIAAANFPQIRILRVRKSASEYPLRWPQLDSPWQKVTPESVREFSAVAYYFAREIQEKEHVPIGIISSLWGGTVAEAWTSMRALTADAALMSVFASRANMMENYADLPLIQADEKQQIEKAKAEGKPIPEFPWRPYPEMWQPAGLYNAMIAPLTKYPIRGVIWYQGESNSKLDRAPMYERVFQTMIRDWRSRWGHGDFPFLFTQIANFNSGPDEDWPTIRDAQRRTLSLRNTAMAVTIDIGNPTDIHATNKRDVGHRLALAARATVYGETNLEFSGPLFRQVSRDGNALRVWFDHADGLRTKGATLTGFEIAGADGKFVPADAKIDGATVIVSNPAVAVAVSVRYGWANSPECNLQNGAGLPASPFRSNP